MALFSVSHPRYSVLGFLCYYYFAGCLGSLLQSCQAVCSALCRGLGSFHRHVVQFMSAIFTKIPGDHRTYYGICALCDALSRRLVLFQKPYVIKLSLMKSILSILIFFQGVLSISGLEVLIVIIFIKTISFSWVS